MEGTTLVIRAAEFAATRHAGQIRKGRAGIPYINHPLAVARLVSDVSPGAEVLAAALLHDVLEDTPVTAAELTGIFGPRVCGIVEELTDDPAWSDLVLEERKAKQADRFISASDAARIVKIADQISNISDLTAEPEIWPRHRHSAYLAGATAIVAACRAASAELAGRFDTRAEGYAAVISGLG